jgi:hypothetical protein
LLSKDYSKYSVVYPKKMEEKKFLDKLQHFYNKMTKPKHNKERINENVE